MFAGPKAPQMSVQMAQIWPFTRSQSNFCLFKKTWYYLVSQRSFTFLKVVSVIQ